MAASDARLGIPEAKRGLVAAAGALLRLPQRIPYHLAMELALTGDPIAAERAPRRRPRQPAGRAGRGVDAALELAATIAAQRAAGARRLQDASSGRAGLDRGEGWAEQGEIAGTVFVSEDAREGATAFAEKREPVWKGR